MSVTTVPNGFARVAAAPRPTASTSTSPGAPGAAFAPLPDAVPAISSGVATQYWAELIPIPAGPARLWFLVDGGWQALSNPSNIQFDAVQRAFLGTGSSVNVWYENGDVVGLVVHG